MDASRIVISDTLFYEKGTKLPAVAQEDKNLVVMCQIDLTTEQRVFAPASLLLFAEICQLHFQRKKAALFTSKNYKKYISVGLHAQKMTNGTCVEEKGAGPKIDE